MYCSYGAECLVDEITQQGYCRCQDACSDVFAPVCGNDGVTYSSECQLKMASCSQQIRIFVQHHGQCDVQDPCEEKQCRYGAQCKPSLDGVTSECVCPEKCTAYGNSRSSRAVCGTDGKDYPNHCELKKTSCREMRPLEVRFIGRCDPCEGVECPNAQVCQLDDNRNAICRCNAICSEDLKPVCGSDGKTYTNECTLRVDACKSRKNIRVVYAGRCSTDLLLIFLGKNPCESLQCGPFQECDIDKYGIASCQCPSNCESVMRPVCASDGQTYHNECELQRNACLKQMNVAVLYSGPCGHTGPCHNYLCAFGAICVLKNNRPACDCPTCTEEFDPVCGTDGMSYTNECKMKKEGCEQRKDINIAYIGLCNTCSRTECEYYAVCELDNSGVPKCVCPEKCVKIEAKVCGDDGVTYQNECELRVSACTKRMNILVASRGPCDLCINVHCKYGARCEDGRCVCPTDCPENYEPVCSSDSTTYQNECEMRRAACMQTQEIGVLFYGECEDVGGSGAETGSGNFACEEEPCRYGGICDFDSEGQPQCVCPFECPAIREPVCGSDGQFYDSDCKMKEQACKTQKKIVIVGKNRCQKRVEVACDGEKPLLNPVTGTDYFCGEGPDSKNCPPRSYCHKTSEFAKCCKEVIVIKSCADTIHGCCPDGKTAAQGPDQAGCPSHCHCNRLGSYSLTCDPASQQCPCKPGVGGLRCDRCEPGFWGLHKISEGSSGCSPCGCDQYGSVRDDCEQMTGRCVCKHGIQGMKCNICPAGTVLGPDGCMDASIAKAVSGSCEQLQCYHGATCKEKNGEAQCICDFKCTGDEKPGKTPEVTTVCGSDGNSYGSECQLRLISCRYQKAIELIGEGSCSKLNFTQPITSTTISALRRTTEEIRTTTTPTETKIARDVTENPAENLIFTTRTPMSTPESTSAVNTMGMPLFTGFSYLELPKLQAYSRLAIELEIRTLTNEGIILYNGQTASGKGDYVSLAVKDGYVEFRYNLGSGEAILRSSQRLQLGRFHRITAKRYQRDGMISVDGKSETTGQSPGSRNYLDLGENLFLGYVPTTAIQIFDNIGIATGFNGCIRHFKISKDYIDLKCPGTHIINAENIQECTDDSCTSMPCQNGASCIVSDEVTYKCLCPPYFTGRHCEVQLDPCASDPCAYGATCLSLTDSKFSCICPTGSSGEVCDQVASYSDEPGLTLDFNGNSYLEFHTLANVAQSLKIEVWFLTRALNGLLLYNDQRPSGAGDFVALTLLNGFLHFSYNLGSGSANISSLEPLTLGVWHSVRVFRMKRSGTLQIDNGPLITGESKASLSELNLGQPFYVGGVPDFPSLKNVLIVQSGLDGAVQKLIVNDEVWDDLLPRAVRQRNIERYIGPPCLPELCQNGARCISQLNDFTCQCVDEYVGKYCNQTTDLVMNDNTVDHPVAFDGSTFLQYSEGSKGMKLKRAKENHIILTFRTTHTYGLLLWMNKGTNMKGDYLAIAIVNGHVQLSFNLGKEEVPLIMENFVPANDNNWHTVVFKRNKRLAHLTVDDSSTTSRTSEPGATELNTDGILWIGGSSAVPSGFPDAYYQGFIGCISSVVIDSEPLKLSDGYFKYCQPS
ncbi:agrin-like [Uloborus diversus]|uniref:agrin-like n=1 Tax=Uloborus diversus TaxID=327109 RepID=UPI002409BCCB|nr:agrin-like [Uloborus diversus]